MAVNINEAQSIVKKLSSEQLIESYKNGSLPQFIVFSEMKSRQDMMKTQPQMPTQTVAESMVGSRDEEPVMQEPAMAARGGQVYSKMPREIDYYSSLTDAQKKMIASRELPDELSALIAQQTRPDRDYNLARAESYLKDARASTETFRKGGEVEEPPVPMSGEEFANAHIRGIIMAESDGVHIDPKTGKLLESPAGAKGITQIMDKTARDPGYGIKPKRDDSRDAAIDFSKDFLKTSYNLFKDPDQSITAYNTGISGVQEAINKANKYGGHWRQYLPNEESKNYYGKVIGKAQLDLPPRQDMAGADTYEPAPVYDNAFLPRGATANDVGIMKNAPGSDKLGSAAYLIKEALKMREGKKEGGPIRLQAGSGGDPISAGVRSLQDDPSNENTITLPDGRRVDIRELIKTRNEESLKRETTPPDQERRNQRLDVQDKIFRGMGEIGDSIKNRWDALPSRGEIYSGIEQIGRPVVDAIDEQRKKVQGGVNPGRDSVLDAAKSLGPHPTLQRDLPTDFDPSPVMYESPSGGLGFHGTNPASIGVDPQVSPAPANVPGPVPVASGPTGTPIKAGPSTGAGSLAGQLAEIKSLMGNSLSDRSKEVFARDEKILASMQNDKLVNTLMAASAVLAKQRVGSVNYGEAVATAGMAAQEAQGRIVKTEREMNKTRLELAAAQDDRDFKAITTAMTRLNHLDTTNTQLQVAVYAANRSAQAQEHSDERARLGQEGSNLRTEIQSLTTQRGIAVRERGRLEGSGMSTPQALESYDNEIKDIDSRLKKLSPSRGSAGQTANPTTPPAGFK